MSNAPDPVQTGYDIVKGINFPWPIAQIILQHHERLDGSGYPNRLKGEAILIEARILGVADVMEAMLAHRPYRPALGLDAALAEIEAGRGRLYDPAAADACIALFRQKGFEFH
jgi:putative two-component system response regulator